MANVSMDFKSSLMFTTNKNKESYTNLHLTFCKKNPQSLKLLWRYGHILLLKETRSSLNILSIHKIAPQQSIHQPLFNPICLLYRSFSPFSYQRIAEWTLTATCNLSIPYVICDTQHPSSDRCFPSLNFLYTMQETAWNRKHTTTARLLEITILPDCLKHFPALSWKVLYIIICICWRNALPICNKVKKEKVKGIEPSPPQKRYVRKKKNTRSVVCPLISLK